MDRASESRVAGAEVSPRWARWRHEIPIDAYEARFAEMEASGTATHGEVDLVVSLGPATVLDAGCGTGRVAIELARRGVEVVGVDLDHDMLGAARRKAPGIEWIHADLSTFDLGRVFDVVALPGNVPLFCRPEDREALVARCASHVARGGRLVLGFTLEQGSGAFGLDELDAAATGAGLVLERRLATWEGAPFVDGGDYAVSVFVRRTDHADA